MLKTNDEGHQATNARTTRDEAISKLPPGPDRDDTTHEISRIRLQIIYLQRSVRPETIEGKLKNGRPQALHRMDESGAARRSSCLRVERMGLAKTFGRRRVAARSKFNAVETLLRNPDFTTVIKAALEKGAEVVWFVEKAGPSAGRE